jgi:hypothetical protein
VADFSRTTCEYLDEHLLALISGRTQQRDTDYQQNQLFAGVNEWRLDLEKRRTGSGEALDFFPATKRPRSLLAPVCTDLSDRNASDPLRAGTEHR